MTKCVHGEDDITLGKSVTVYREFCCKKTYLLKRKVSFKYFNCIEYHGLYFGHQVYNYLSDLKHFYVHRVVYYFSLKISLYSDFSYLSISVV